MKFRILAVAAISLAMLAGATNSSKAFHPPPVAAVGVSAGAIATAGFLGVVAALCAYDLYLKINGLKNWDGTEKVVHHRRHRH